MSKTTELSIEVANVRHELLALMTEARTVDDALAAAMHCQVSLKASIMLSLDHLDKIDERLRHP